MPNNDTQFHSKSEAAGHISGVRDTGAGVGLPGSLDVGDEVGPAGGATGVGGAGGATAGAGAGGAASGDRTISGITPAGIGITSPADSEGARPGASAAATGGASSGDALHADNSSLHPGGLHPGPGSGSGAK